MFDKEKFRENQELESTGYAVGHTHRELKERCLILMRFLEVRKVYSTGLTAEELAEEMDWIEELEIARELYSGIICLLPTERNYAAITAERFSITGIVVWMWLR